ncbi:MAG: T9SS type A sorting domain-containing protein, partial [Bacteroidales bacterium]|nr:T9SS type A sorting domain-containing protein [Bacteroidales bacterium]
NAACFKDDYFFIPDERYVYKLNYLGELFINFGENGKIDVKEDYDLHIKKVLEIDEIHRVVVTGIILINHGYGTGYSTFLRSFLDNGSPFSLVPWVIDMLSGDPVPLPGGEDETVISMFKLPNYQFAVVGGPVSIFGNTTNTFILNFLDRHLVNIYNGRGEFRNFIAMDLPVAIYENSFFIGGKNGEIANFDLNLLLNEGFANEGVFTLPDDIRYLDIKVQGSDKLLMAGYDNTSGTNKAVLARFAIGTNSSANIENISNSISIYPNPATDILHFNQAQTYEIFDIQGRVLKKSEAEQNSANISELKNGMYFIKIENKLFKFIKN